MNDLCDCDATSLGVKSPVNKKSQRSAASGHCTAREVQAHTAVSEGKKGQTMVEGVQLVMLAIC